MAAGDHPALDVRQFRPADAGRVRELNEVAMATTPEYLPELPDPDLESPEDHYLEGVGELLVGSLEDRVVAMGGYVPPSEWKESFVALGPDTAELTRMRVDPDWHGEGFGTAIYRELERRARSEGFERFVLDTGTANDRSRGFYEGLDFECLDEVSLEWGSRTIHLALYEKRIADGRD